MSSRFKTIAIVLSFILLFGLLSSLVTAIGIIVIKDALNHEDKVIPNPDLNSTFTYNFKTLPCSELVKYFDQVVGRTDLKCRPSGFPDNKFNAKQ